LREVVDAVHDEKTAHDDPPDDERNVVDAGWHKPSSPFRERNHTMIDVISDSTQTPTAGSMSDMGIFQQQLPVL
jgi:hypothetical protein